MRIAYASEQAVEFADRSMEAISYYAIEASAKLAQERGAYHLRRFALEPGHIAHRLHEDGGKQRGEDYFKVDRTRPWTGTSCATK